MFVLLYHNVCTDLAAQRVATWHKDGAPDIIHADHTVCLIMFIKRMLFMYAKGSWLHVYCLCFTACLDMQTQQLQLTVFQTSFQCNSGNTRKHIKSYWLHDQHTHFACLACRTDHACCQ